MQKVKLFEQFLFEIGDRSAQPYKYKLRGTKIEDFGNKNSRLYANFTTETGLIYELLLYGRRREIEVDFAVLNIGNEYAVTNRGEMYRVMTTIANIIERVLDANPDIVQLKYQPKENNNDYGLSRDRLYKLFIKKAAKATGRYVKFDNQANMTVVTITK